jgi:hypothetical protein
MGSQRHKIHLKIVTYLESMGSLDDGLIAHHWERSGNHVKAALYWEKATQKVSPSCERSRYKKGLDLPNDRRQRQTPATARAERAGEAGERRQPTPMTDAT